MLIGLAVRMKMLIQGVASYGAGAAIGPACWPHHDLIVVLAGTLSLRVAGSAWELAARDGILIPPGQAFAGCLGPSGGTIWVQHFEAAPGEVPGELRRGKRPRLVGGGADDPLVGALLARLHELREAAGPVAQRRRAGLLGALLQELAWRLRSDDRPLPTARGVPAAVAWAEANPAGAPTIGHVARRAGLSESHFRSVFRRLRGQSAGRWLRALRMAEARRLLSSTDRTLKAVAMELGFSDAVSFNRAFAAFHGRPPGRYRRDHPRPV